MHIDVTINIMIRIKYHLKCHNYQSFNISNMNLKKMHGRNTDFIIVTKMSSVAELHSAHCIKASTLLQFVLRLAGILACWLHCCMAL